MMTNKANAQITVDAKHHRYTIAIEGEPVGYVDYIDRNDQRIFYHTVVDPEFGGRGLATILIEEALDTAREEGKRIVPVCSMVDTVLKKHPEYDAITAPVTTEIQGWVQTQLNG